MSTATDSKQAHSIQCMEIWGGNEAFDNALSVPGIDAWVYSQPHASSHRGGDIHYVSLCAGNAIARFALADVSGHGEQVGELAHRLRKLMRRHIGKLDQTRFIRALNAGFQHLASDGKFATAVLVTYYWPTDHLIVCNAGHPRPLLYRAQADTWSYLDYRIQETDTRGISNPPLGIVSPTEYHQFAIKLARDDLVVLYTDSLPESTGAAGEMLGAEGLLSMVKGLDLSDPCEVKTTLLNQIEHFRGGQPPDDDTSIIVLHHNAADPPRRSIGEVAMAIARMLGLSRI